MVQLPQLVKETSKLLQLAPNDVRPEARAAESIRRVLGNLGSIVAGIAELRNSYGTGHGKALGRGGLGPRHARLAVGAASTLAIFLFETYEYRLNETSSVQPDSGR
jgi:Abortive infection C-terminus